MSNVEREYIKTVDNVILKASGKTLKKLQQLDMKTQLNAATFYDAFIEYDKKPKKENISSTTYSKNKQK